MTEFVSALFKFVPENDDELPLEIGERVEVLEKDQFHNDGWWTGRNASGRVGIFPANYAESVPTPPSPNDLTSPDSATLQRQFDTLYDSIEMHFAQKQSLARRPTYASYVSSDTEEEEGDRPASKGLRLKIALDARKARAEARHRQKEFGINTTLPPVDADASGSEADEPESAQRHRLFESDDEGDADPFERILFRKPTRGKSLRRAATRRRPSLPETEPVPALPDIPSQVTLVSFADGARTLSPEPIAPLQVASVPPRDTFSATSKDNAKSEHPILSPIELATPATPFVATRLVPHKTESLALSEYSILRAPSSKNRPTRPQGQPQTWTVSDVVVFFKSRGFSDDICSSFEEQEITGDVLAALNLDNLESEIGISALGTRKRIIAAIGDLELTPPHSRPSLLDMKDSRVPFGLPSPVVSAEESESSQHEAPIARSLSPNGAVASLPTPEPSPRKGAAELPSSIAPSLPSPKRMSSPPSSSPPTIAISSLPTPPETHPTLSFVPSVPRSPELLPASLTASRKSSTGALVGPRPRPVSTSSATSAASMSPSSNAMHLPRPSRSPPPVFTAPSPPSSSLSSTFLPPGAARPRIPGAPLPYEGLPHSLIPGGLAAGRSTHAQHGRSASSAVPSKTALPAPVFRQTAGLSVADARPVSKLAQAHQQSASVSHITTALISGPFEVARVTASAASGNKDLPNLLTSGRTRVGAPRGPRGWHIRS